MFSKKTRNLTVAVLSLVMALTLAFGFLGFNTQASAAGSVDVAFGTSGTIVKGTWDPTTANGYTVYAGRSAGDMKYGTNGLTLDNTGVSVVFKVTTNTDVDFLITTTANVASFNFSLYKLTDEQFTAVENGSFSNKSYSGTAEQSITTGSLSKTTKAFSLGTLNGAYMLYQESKSSSNSSKAFLTKLTFTPAVKPVTAISTTTQDSAYVGDTYKFPTTASVSLEDGTVATDVGIKWTDASGAEVKEFNATATGTYTFTASLNDSNYEGNATATLTLEVTQITRTITEITVPQEVYTMLLGADLSTAGLPATLKATWTAESAGLSGTVDVPVTWAFVEGFDSTTLGEKGVDGTISPVEGFTMDATHVQVRVLVKLEEISGEYALNSTLFYNTSSQQLYGVNTYTLEGKGEFEIVWNEYVAGSKTVTGKLGEKTGYTVTATVSANVYEAVGPSESVIFAGNADAMTDLNNNFNPTGSWSYDTSASNISGGNFEYMGVKAQGGTLTICLTKPSTVVLSLGGNNKGTVTFNGETVKSGVQAVVNVERQLPAGAYELSTASSNQFIRYIGIFNEDLCKYFIASVDTNGTANGNTLPTLPDKGETTFAGWTADNGATIIPGGTSVKAQEQAAWNAAKGSAVYAGTVYTAVYNEVIDPNKNYTVTFASNNELYGKVDLGEASIKYGTEIVVNGETLTIGEYTITAIANEPSAESTYAFAQWNLNGHTTVDGTITLVAEFTATAREYRITYQGINGELVNGTVTGPATAKYGEKVTVNATANEGYVLADMWYNDNPMSITIQKFTMPAQDVVVRADFLDTVAAKWEGYGDLDKLGQASFGERDKNLPTDGTSYTMNGVDGVAITFNSLFYDSKRHGHYPLAGVDTTAGSNITITVPETVAYKVNITIRGITFGNSGKTATARLAGGTVDQTADFSNSGFASAAGTVNKLEDLGTCTPATLKVTGLTAGTYTFTAETNRIFVNMVLVEKSEENLLGEFNGEHVYGTMSYMGAGLRTEGVTGVRFGFKLVLSTNNAETIAQVATAMNGTFTLTTAQDNVYNIKSYKLEGNALIMNAVIINALDAQNNAEDMTKCNMNINVKITLNIGTVALTAEGANSIANVAGLAYAAGEIDLALAQKYGYVQA